MAKIVKNLSLEVKTWGGVAIQPSGSYTCNNQQEADAFVKDDNFISDLVAGSAKVEIDGELILSPAESIVALASQKVEVTNATLSEPFAAPTFRTKRKGAGFYSVAPGGEIIIDLLLTEERWAHGGVIVYEGAKVGDTLIGEIVDKDGVIPAPYRAVLCENYPIVANYLDEEPIPPGDGYREINTYPLNARITPGLYLRVKFKACNKGSTREVGMGYYLTKKL